MSQRERTLVTPVWVRIASETSFSPGWLLIAFPAVLYPLYRKYSPRPVLSDTGP